MRHVRMILCAGAALSAHPAFAADALKFGPPPAWVHQQAIPAGKTTDAPVAVLLHDQQIKFDSGKVTTYNEVAFKIQSPQGLSAGSLSIIWQPATDTVIVNKVRIRRGDQDIDVLANGQTFTILRRETNLDAATLDGTLTGNIQPEGLQQGDIVDFATTSESSDPVFKGHVETLLGGWNGLPIAAAHASLSWPTNLHVSFKESASLPPARRLVSGATTQVELSGTDLQPIVPPQGAPDRYTIGRIAEATDFSSWSDIANLAMPLFRDASVIPASGSLHDEVEKIRTSTTDPKRRAEEALALVQDRVRYVALLMGQGGYVPAAAETTWSRRFGDCKAKSALLLGILHSLGIEAEPVLVQSKSGDMIADRLPMISLFDHVIARAHIGGKDYWLDGTRTGDTDLDSIQVPDFGWALPVIPNAQLVHLVPRPLDSPDSEIVLDIDASGGVYAPAPATADQTVRGDLAIGMQSALSALSDAQRQEFFQTYWSKSFDLVTFKSGAFTFDKNKRELHLTMTGSAKLDWSGGYFHVPDSTVGYRPNLDRQPGPLHDVPFAVDYPSYNKWVVRLHVPPSLFDGRKLGSADIHETLAGIEYNRTTLLSGNVLTVETSARSIVPEISYKDAKAAEPRLIALSDEDVALPMPNSYRTTAADLDAMKKEQPASSDDLVTRGNSFLDNARFDDAIADFTKALSINANDAVALADRAIAYTWQRKFDLATKDLTAALAIDPSNAVALRARGLEAELNGDCTSAVDSYTKSLETDRDNAFAFAHRANCEKVLHRYAAALSDVDAAVKQSSNSWPLRVLRLDLLARDGQKDAATREADVILNDNPDAAKLVAVAKVFARDGMQKEAMDAMDRAIAIKPDPSLYVTKARLRPPSDYDGRMADLDAALKLAPTDAGVLSAKSDLLASHSDLRGALAIYDEAIKKSPALSPLTVGRALLLYQLGRKVEGEQLLSQWRRLAGTASELNDLCSRKATAGVLLQSAEKDCKDALHVNPNFVSALENLGLVELRLGKFDEAVADYDLAISKSDEASAYMGRAIAYARKGDSVRALADRARPLDEDPGIEARYAEYGVKFDAASAQHQSAAGTKNAPIVSITRE